MKRKLAEIINVIFGFRKFLLMLLLFGVGIVFRLKSLISGSEMVDLFKNTTIAFMSANGVEHIVSVVKDYVASKNGQSQPSEVNLADTDESNDEEEVEPKNG